MRITDRASRLATCLDAAHHFLLSERDALEVIEHQLRTIGQHWSTVCAEAGLTATDRRLLWGRQFLNPFGFENLEGSRSAIGNLGRAVLAAGTD